MSTPSTADDGRPRTANSPSPPFFHTPKSLLYAINHVFLPVSPPKKTDDTPENNLSLVRAVCAAARTYGTYVSGPPQQDRWCRIIKMLENLEACVQSNYSDTDRVLSQLRGMEIGDVLSYFIPWLNAAILLTKRENSMLCEAFQVSTIPEDTEGPVSVSVTCSYPGSMVKLPNDVIDHEDFQIELARLLSHVNNSDVTLPFPTDPRFINVLLDNILRRVGHTASLSFSSNRATLLSGISCGIGRTVSRVTKHIRNHARGRSEHYWRRSRLWLVIKVALQMAADPSPEHSSYKSFMLFFRCTLANDENHTHLSRGLLHLMSSTVFRRLDKFGSSTPNWLREMALDTYTSLQEILDTRWKQLSIRRSPFRNPSQEDLIQDTQLSLSNSREYIRKALETYGCEHVPTPFHPNHLRRGTLQDFLNGTFFDEAYDMDPAVALFDVERSVEESIDDWVASVRDVDDACVRLALLMEKYISKDDYLVDGDPERSSIWKLTVIELCVALDKLVVKEVPLLVEYPPIISIHPEDLFLRKATNLHRLSCALQYISARHSQSRWKSPVLSSEFTQDSFPIHYYDQSPRLQQLKARIDSDSDYSLRHASRQLVAGNRVISQSPLPTSPLHAKVVVFELQCPACIRIWRSTINIPNMPGELTYGCRVDFRKEVTAGFRLLSDVNALQRDQRQCLDEPDYSLTLTFLVDLAYIDDQSPPILRYLQRKQWHWEYPPELGSWRVITKHLNDRDRKRARDAARDQDPRHMDRLYTGYYYKLPFRRHGSRTALERYAHSTSHTSNDVLAAQAACPLDHSLDEFVASAHLRSGGSLQWLNILRGLRTRTLNLRHEETYFLILHAISVVGPFDFVTGTWIWHQELQDPSFCAAILTELEVLLVEVGASSMDSILMNGISLLLTRILGASPGKDVSANAITLLENVRRKTFSCVQDLLAPGSGVHSELLFEMAATCQSTFDADHVTLHKLIHFPEDIDILLSCSFSVRTHLGGFDNYPSLLSSRERRLSLALEEPLRTFILADASDYGVDLAVGRVFTSHRPGTRRWEQLHRPSDHWLACEAKETANQFSSTVYINLLNGKLRVTGPSIDGLLDGTRDEFRGVFWIFSESLGNQRFSPLPSNLPGMDFMALGMMSKRKLYFSFRGDVLVLRMQCDRTTNDLILIPPSEFKGDLPAVLVDEHVHLLDPSANSIEIRLRNRLWEDSGHWRIDLVSGSCRTDKGCETLVDIRSPTWTMLSKCLERLRERSSRQPEDLMVTTSRADSTSTLQLSATLWHHGLSFFVNECEELESRDFKGMVYDEDQCVMALFGLESLFVLRPKANFSAAVPENLIPRRILVPNLNGQSEEEESRTDGDKIWFGTRFCGGETLYHTYSVDTELGCLMGDGSLSSTEFLACLHAITSWHRPDPLTGKTGAQEALRLLQSARLQSIIRREVRRHRYCWDEYPHLLAVLDEIRTRHYWNRGSRPDSSAIWPRLKWAAYLFPPNATQIGLDSLLLSCPAPMLVTRIPLHPDSITTSSESYDISALEIFSRMSTDHSFQREYLDELDVSAKHLRSELRMTHRTVGNNSVETLTKHYAQCRSAFLESLEILKQGLGPTTNSHEQTHIPAGQWPSITAAILLRYLSSTSPIDITPDWKKCLTSLALLLLDLQRARRLLCFALKGLEEDLSKELENEGCDGWKPEDYPDWLLIQIEGNFLIRRFQAEAAMQIISPWPPQNTVTQVNMGEGKTSVIIPIAAAALADGKQLVRVIVPKTQTVQTLDLLVSRLGGLANRPIYHLPFSRTPEYVDGEVQIDYLRKLVRLCMTERGILLVQPEHVVSLKLMSVKAQHDFVTGASHEANSASEWLDLQKWIDSHVRDILDESDEILHPRFQLTYTLGTQQHMDGYPERWEITQQVLQLVREHLHSLAKNAPDSIQYECSQPGSFPHVRILQASDVGECLISRLRGDVMAGRLRSFNIFQHFSPELHGVIRDFISDKDIHMIPGTTKRVEEHAKDSEQGHLWNGLLLLRGLLTTNILLFALSERRWRVDYGLVPNSQSRRATTMLAVPYRAKDVLAPPNTEFGHPDLTIILTCLSYYYTGLSEQQLRSSFAILLNQDDPSMEYELWVKSYDRKLFPDSPTELALYPSALWDNVISPLLSRNQVVIDFYLSQAVFPKEAKEYPWKLPGSGWDLAEKREKLVTGFSGTNDTRLLLPLSIAYHGLDRQMGTNAKVLAYLLRPKNDFYMMAHDNGERLATSAFLRLVTEQSPEIRVLLDVGAQVLDLSNKQVAKAWLDMVPNTDGGVYFNEKDELMTIARDGRIQPMSSSSLSQRLEQCVVYLDHAHTRGTDIKFPIGSRAAVTLGPKVTKDALVQGCMRMRKLGHGHSVMFFAPPLIDRSIRATASKTDSHTSLTTVDILCWAIRETWADIQQRAPHWAQQGMNHKLRYNAWSRFVNDECTGEQLSVSWLQRDLKSLGDLYAPCDATTDTSGDPSALRLDPDIRRRCRALGVLSIPSAQMDEEQERELQRQRERERESELPPRAKPNEHLLHPAVVGFVETGVIPPLALNSVFRPAFGTLKEIPGVIHDSEAVIWSPLLLATADFCETVEPQSTPGTWDQYLRPVQWILSSTKSSNKVLVLLSPFEADQLMPKIKAGNHVHLHLYAPRTSKRMQPSDDLWLYSIPSLHSNWTPPWALIDQLNLFSGQLYLKDHEAYVRLGSLLGISVTKEFQKDSDLTIRRSPLHIVFNVKTNASSGSRLATVKALLAIRNRGLPFAHTHMGRIFQRKVLTEQDFEAESSRGPQATTSGTSTAQERHNAPPYIQHFLPFSVVWLCFLTVVVRSRASQK